jgi:hypothetical protein
VWPDFALLPASIQIKQYVELLGYTVGVGAVL